MCKGKGHSVICHCRHRERERERERSIALLFLNLGARREWVVNAKLRLIYPGKRDPESIVQET